MTLFVFDTDHLTLFQHNHPKVLWHVLARLVHSLAVTIITVEEELTGWYTALRKAKNTTQLAPIYARFTDGIRQLASFRILSFDLPAIHRYDQLKALKLGVKKMDLRIAAIALENAATLVTRNKQDFQRIPGLTTEDWSL